MARSKSISSLLASSSSTVSNPDELPEVTVSDDGEVRHLHLGTPWIQGSMRVKEPFVLELEYIQRMMAWLLFVDPASVPERHAMQLGLGAGAITKFCHKKLRMCSTAIELNPQVLSVCRSWFKLPPDGPTLRVVLADAAQEIRKDEWRGTVDALAVDLYDHNAAAPVLDSADFYADCRALLTDDGAAKATPWCWRSAPPPRSKAPNCCCAARPSRRVGTCRPPSGAGCSIRWRCERWAWCLPLPLPPCTAQQNCL